MRLSSDGAPQLELNTGTLQLARGHGVGATATFSKSEVDVRAKVGVQDIVSLETGMVLSSEKQSASLALGVGKQSLGVSVTHDSGMPKWELRHTYTTPELRVLPINSMRKDLVPGVTISCEYQVPECLWGVAPGYTQIFEVSLPDGSTNYVITNGVRDDNYLNAVLLAKAATMLPVASGLEWLVVNGGLGPVASRLEWLVVNGGLRPVASGLEWLVTKAGRGFSLVPAAALSSAASANTAPMSVIIPSESRVIDGHTAAHGGWECKVSYSRPLPRDLSGVIFSKQTDSPSTSAPGEIDESTGPTRPNSTTDLFDFSLEALLRDVYKPVSRTDKRGPSGPGDVPAIDGSKQRSAGEDTGEPPAEEAGAAAGERPQSDDARTARMATEASTPATTATGSSIRAGEDAVVTPPEGALGPAWGDTNETHVNSPGSIAIVNGFVIDLFGTTSPNTPSFNTSGLADAPGADTGTRALSTPVEQPATLPQPRDDTHTQLEHFGIVVLTGVLTPPQQPPTVTPQLDSTNANLPPTSRQDISDESRGAVMMTPELPTPYVHSALKAIETSLMCDMAAMIINTPGHKPTGLVVMRHVALSAGSSVATKIVGDQLQSTLGESSHAVTGKLLSAIIALGDGSRADRRAAAKRMAFEAVALYVVNDLGIGDLGRTYHGANGQLFGSGVISSVVRSDSVSVNPFGGVIPVTVGIGFEQEHLTYRTHAGDIIHRKQYGTAGQAKFMSIARLSAGFYHGVERAETAFEYKDGELIKTRDYARKFSGEYGIRLNIGNRQHSWRPLPAHSSRTRKVTTELNPGGIPKTETTETQSTTDFGYHQLKVTEKIEMGVLAEDKGSSDSNMVTNDGLRVRTNANQRNQFYYRDRVSRQEVRKTKFKKTSKRNDNSRKSLEKTLTVIEMRETQDVSRDDGSAIETRGSTETTNVAPGTWARMEEDKQRRTETLKVDSTPSGGRVETTKEEVVSGVYNQVKRYEVEEQKTMDGKVKQTTHRVDVEGGSYTDKRINDGEKVREAEMLQRSSTWTRVDETANDGFAIETRGSTETTNVAPGTWARMEEDVQRHTETLKVDNTPSGGRVETTKEEVVSGVYNQVKRHEIEEQVTMDGKVKQTTHRIDAEGGSYTDTRINDGEKVREAEQLQQSSTSAQVDESAIDGFAIETRGSTETTNVAPGTWARMEEDKQRRTNTLKVDSTPSGGKVEMTKEEVVSGVYNQVRRHEVEEQVTMNGEVKQTTHRVDAEGGSYTDERVNDGEQVRASEKLQQTSMWTLVDESANDGFAIETRGSTEATNLAPGTWARMEEDKQRRTETLKVDSTPSGGRVETTKEEVVFGVYNQVRQREVEEQVTTDGKLKRTTYRFDAEGGSYTDERVNDGEKVREAEQLQQSSTRTKVVETAAGGGFLEAPVKLGAQRVGGADAEVTFYAGEGVKSSETHTDHVTGERSGWMTSDVKGTFTSRELTGKDEKMGLMRAARPEDDVATHITERTYNQRSGWASARVGSAEGSKSNADAVAKALEVPDKATADGEFSFSVTSATRIRARSTVAQDAKKRLNPDEAAEVHADGSSTLRFESHVYDEYHEAAPALVVSADERTKASEGGDALERRLGLSADDRAKASERSDTLEEPAPAATLPPMSTRERSGTVVHDYAPLRWTADESSLAGGLAPTMRQTNVRELSGYVQRHKITSGFDDDAAVDAKAIDERVGAVHTTITTETTTEMAGLRSLFDRTDRVITEKAEGKSTPTECTETARSWGAGSQRAMASAGAGIGSLVADCLSGKVGEQARRLASVEGKTRNEASCTKGNELNEEDPLPSPAVAAVQVKTGAEGDPLANEFEPESGAVAAQYAKVVSERVGHVAISAGESFVHGAAATYAASTTKLELGGKAAAAAAAASVVAECVRALAPSSGTAAGQPAPSAKTRLKRAAANVAFAAGSTVAVQAQHSGLGLGAAGVVLIGAVTREFVGAEAGGDPRSREQRIFDGGAATAQVLAPVAPKAAAMAAKAAPAVVKQATKAAEVTLTGAARSMGAQAARLAPNATGAVTKVMRKVGSSARVTASKVSATALIIGVIDATVGVVQAERSFNDPYDSSVVTKEQCSMRKGEAVVGAVAQAATITATAAAVGLATVAAAPLTLGALAIILPPLCGEVVKMAAKFIFRRLYRMYCKRKYGYDPDDVASMERHKKQKLHAEKCAELGITQTLKDHEFKKAMHRACLECHPDKKGSESTSEFQRVYEEWQRVQQLRSDLGISKVKVTSRTWRKWLSEFADELLASSAGADVSYSRVCKFLRSLGFSISHAQPSNALVPVPGG